MRTATTTGSEGDVTTTEPIATVVAEGVIDIRLPWPDVRNAMGPDEANALADALDGATGRPDTRALLVSAEGSAFSAGGNLRSVAELATRGEQAVRDSVYSAFQRLYRTIVSSPVPVIAVVDGPAIGFGCDLALACDVRVAGPRAEFRYGWANIGLISAAGGLLELRELLGRAALWDFVAGTGLDQRRAVECGVAIAADDATTIARDLAARLAAIDRDVLAATKELIDITDRARYLTSALDYQVGFITAPAFATRANAVLRRTSASPAAVPVATSD
jgi:enoyl-CoA hydratase/carnithine racemase